MSVLNNISLGPLRKAPESLVSFLTNGEKIIGDTYRHHRPTGNHVTRVIYGVAEVCTFLSIPCAWAIIASAHHDAGKLLLPQSLLRVTKPDDEEIRQFQTHSQRGYEYIRALYLMDETADQHEITDPHETADQHEIEILARIVGYWHRHQWRPHEAIISPFSPQLSAAEERDIDIIGCIGNFVDFVDSITRRRTTYAHRRRIDDIDGLLTDTRQFRPELLDLAEEIIPARVFQALAPAEFSDYYRAFRKAPGYHNSTDRRAA